ncbi:MAG TPA: FtsL-like putative cell division protein [Bacteroidales bacterium]|nr:FtsL-like putative cell division protein [Bacteroidales bacterium]
MTPPVNKIKDTKARGRLRGKRRFGRFSFLKFLHALLDGSFLNRKDIFRHLVFAIFIAALMLIYIGNYHMAEKKIRKISKVTNVNKELSFNYHHMKTKLYEKNRSSYLAEKLAPMGIRPLVEPPEKIFIKP